MAKSKAGTIAAVVLSVAAVLASPLVVVGFSLADAAASYDGVCGPYAPDISAHPCSFDTYMQNQLSPFAVAGLIILSPVIMIVAAAIVVAVWSVVLIGRWVWRRARAPQPSGSGMNS